MNENTLKLVLACTLIVGHFIIIATVSALWIEGGFFTDEFLSILGMIIPLLGVYTAPIISYYVTQKFKIRYKSNRHVLVAAILLSLFCLVLLEVLAIYKASGGNISFEQFSSLILAFETILGLYLGVIIRSHFDRSE